MASAHSTRHRTLVIGWDGATWDLAANWMKAGRMPHLARLMQRGGGGRLRSVLPVLSPSAWASFTTGVNPGRHGIFDFVQPLPDSYRLRLVTSRDLQAPTLWRLLSDGGKRVAVVNVPLTYPAEPVNGVMITGLGTPDRQIFTHPPDLSHALRAIGYRVNKSVFYRPGGEGAFLKDVYDVTQRVAETGLSLFKQEPWDFFMLVFRDTDEMSHFFWKHMDPRHPAHQPGTDGVYATALLDYYQYLDGLTGQFIDAAGAEVNVLIMSDHGMGPLYKDVFLNEWLRQQGWLATASQQANRPGSYLARWGLTRSNVSRLLQRLGLVSLERWLRTILGDKINLLPAHNRATFPDAIDWGRTRAYSYGYHGQIFLNVQGREPDGIVRPDHEYFDLRTQVERALRALTDPDDGLPVVTDVIPQEAAFQGPEARRGADLVVVMRDLAYITRQGYEFGIRPGHIFSRPTTHESGSHRLNGLLIFGGPDFRSCGETESQSILDLAPTILHLSGLPVPKLMEGKVRMDVLQASMAQPVEAVYVESSTTSGSEAPQLTEDEEAELIVRLRNLGYLG